MDWNDINLKQYEELRQKTYNIPQEEYTNVAIEVLLGIKDPETSISYVEYLAHVEELNFLTKPPKKNKLKEYYIVKDHKKYNLDMEIQNFSTVQFQDFTTYTKQRPTSMIDMLSVVLIPDGHKYNDGYSMDEAKEDIGSMSVCDGEAIVNFFFLWFKKYVTVSLDCLERQMKKQEKKGKLTEEQKKVLEIMKQKMTLMNLMVESMA